MQLHTVKLIFLRAGKTCTKPGIPTENNCRFNCLNCNGLGNRLKRSFTFSWLVANHKGITFLQETHSTEAAAPEWNKYDCDIYGTRMAPTGHEGFAL